MEELIEVFQKLGIDFESGRIDADNCLYIITKDKYGNKIANYFFTDDDEPKYLNCFKHGAN